MYIFGITLGILLLIAKYGSFYLLTGGDKQWSIPFTNDQGVRTWVYKSNVRKGLLDLGAGYIGAHVLIAFGGSILAMIAMVTYIITCMTAIFFPIFIKGTINWFHTKIYGKRRIPCY